MSETNPRQMCCFINNKAVIELMNKFVPGKPGSLSHLHMTRNDKGDESYVQTSRVGINLVDYAKSPSVFVQENISPSQLKELYYEAILKRNDFSFSGNGQKIFGKPDAAGYSTVRSIQINRQGSYMDKRTNQIVYKNYPWTVKVQNGKGIKEVNNKTGGTSIKKGSFICDKEVSINMTDGDFFALINEAVTYMNAWENYVAHAFVKAHEDAIIEYERKRKSEKVQT